MRRIAILIADDGITDLRPVLGEIAREIPSARVAIERIGAAALAAHGTALPLRALEAAGVADAVFVLPKEGDIATAAALIGLREQLGFTKRFFEPQFARMWLAERGSRGCYILGRLPAGLIAVALALEFSFGDFEGAERLRRRLAGGDHSHTAAAFVA